MAGAEFDVVVRGGRVFVDAESRLLRADVGITAGVVAAVAPGGLPPGAGREEIDAAGLLVLPGGVDSHCHIEQRTSAGLLPCDDFHSASVSALCGGTTTIIPFACQHKGQRIRDVVRQYRASAEKSAADYAIHVIVSDPGAPHAIADLEELLLEGVTSIKVYMTYDALKLTDRQMLDVLALCRRGGGMVMVHAESDGMISWITDRLLGADLILPRHHAVARPEVAEREAAHRAISFAEYVGTPLLVVHVSGAEAAGEVARARARGAPIFAETCPQYLTLTKERLHGHDHDPHEGAKYLCCPPLRDEASQEAMWRALRDGALQVVSSDHSAYRFADDGSGRTSKQVHGKEAPFNKVPMGLPGLEARLALVWARGVAGGRLGPGAGAAGDELDACVRRFVAVTSTNPAKLYGAYPRKGAVAVGSDADIVLWDPSRSAALSTRMLHDDIDYTPYDGIRLDGLPVCTLSRGEVVFRRGGAPEEDIVAAARGRGRWVACGRPDLLGWAPAPGDAWPSAEDPVLRRASM